MLTLGLVTIGLTWLAPVAPPVHSAVPTPRHALVCMAKKGPKVGTLTEVVSEDGEDFQVMAEEEEAADTEKRDQAGARMVNGMTTSLGREAELKPFPGPPVIDEPVDTTDERPLFVLFSRYLDGHMPNEVMQQAYVQWLEEDGLREDGSVAVCLPNYMLSAQSFDEFWETGAVLTDDDIARLDAEEEAELAAATAAAAAAEDEEADVADFLPAAERAMEPAEVAFVLGHLTVCRAASHAAAAAWASSDPVQQAGGYADVQLHEWTRSAEAELRVQGTGECLQSYCIHCIDRADAGDLRANTREAHLEWLRESGRAVMAGPLLEPSGANAAEAVGVGDRVGSLLVVNGDDLDEVKDWANTDPYNTAGLFASVSVAPLNKYSIDGVLADF